MRKYIGAYLAVLGGVDAVLFGGGIGEHAAEIGARICDGMDWCGLVLDRDLNDKTGALSAVAWPASAGDDAKLEAYVVAV